MCEIRLVFDCLENECVIFNGQRSGVFVGVL